MSEEVNIARVTDASDEERIAYFEAMRDHWRKRAITAEGELDAVGDAINLYGGETLHQALDAIGWRPRGLERDE